ncbi:MAG: hypothetical protein ACRDIB_13910 [Ardenticatenaceae bacterium]
MMRRLWIMVGAGLICVAFLLLITHQASSQGALLFALRYVSPDQQITPLGEKLIGRMVYLGATALFLLGGMLIGLTNPAFRAGVARVSCGAYRPAGRRPALVAAFCASHGNRMSLVHPLLLQGVAANFVLSGRWTI